MLTREDNELLIRVGPGTPMGALMRRYWIPVLRSDELEPGRRVKRVKLLGEDLVAFRSRDGRVGLLEELCSHRRASLYFARNEDAGLRCVPHPRRLGTPSQGRALGRRREGAADRLDPPARHGPQVMERFV